MVEGEGIEVAEGEGEEGWGGEEVGQAVAVALEGGGDGVCEIGELGRGESGEGCHDDGFSGGLVCHDRITCKTIRGMKRSEI